MLIIFPKSPSLPHLKFSLQIFFKDPHIVSRTPIQLNYRKGYLIFEFAGMVAADSWVLTQIFPNNFKCYAHQISNPSPSLPSKLFDLKNATVFPFIFFTFYFYFILHKLNIQ